jgi:PEP-CTERM motif
MNKAIVVAAAIFGLVISMPAGANVIGFTDGFAPGTWTVNFTGTLLTPGGSLGSVTETPTTFTLVGGNGTSPDPANFVPDCSGATYGLAGPCEEDVFHTAVPFTTFLFHWAYTTADSGGPPGDIFGMLINGTRVQLSDPGGPVSQSGNVIAHAVTSFGWFVNCTDCIEGAATATITNFQAQTAPEPATLALIGLGLAASCFMRRRVS